MSTTTEKNPWYVAKELLVKDFEDGHILEDMTAQQVRGMRTEYLAVRADRFACNFKHLKENGFKVATKKKKVNPWSIAKPIAHQDYIAGTITDGMRPADVHKMRPEFQAVALDRFVDNFKRLKQRIQTDQARADTDFEAYSNDRKLHTLARDTPEEWHGSPAEQLLRNELVSGAIRNYTKPSELHKTQEAYSYFPLKVFRKHLYQERRRMTESGYWLVKKAKKQAQKEAKRAGATYKDDQGFYDPVLDFLTLDDWKL